MRPWFAATLLTLALLVPGSADAQQVSFGVNGDTWRISDELEDGGQLAKIALLRGIYDGLWYGRSPDRSLYPTKVSWDVLLEGLDDFYKDFRNRQILVVWALRVLKLEIEGKSREAEGEVRFLRCYSIIKTEAGKITPDLAQQRRAECEQLRRIP